MSLTGEPSTDKRVLQERAYADGDNLRARAGIYAWLTGPRPDLHAAVLGQVEWRAGERVLDVGCGPGAYLQRLRALAPEVHLTGLDLSPGMLREARAAVADASFVVGDVQRLPFAADEFDDVLAPHMLYHAPDLDLAVGELRRVLRPGGVALVVTNGHDHLEGFRQLLARSLGVADWMRTFRRFDLDGGEAILRRYFDTVERRDFRGELEVREVDPVVDYVASTRSSLEPQLPHGLAWDDALVAVRTAVEHDVGHTGAFRSATHSGLLVCR
jgi:ubiquinone/menaquinone biosynthesis C-methylase UbiE